MSELWVKTLETGGFEDGDVFRIFTDRQISLTWLNHVSAIRGAGFTSGRLRPIDSIQYVLRNESSLYRFERKTKTTCERHNLQTGDVVVITDGVPFFCNDSQRQSILRIGEYLRERKKKHTHHIFGTPGREVWFSAANRNITTFRIKKLWTAVETMTPIRKSACQKMPIGKRDGVNQLMLTIDTPEKERIKMYTREAQFDDVVGVARDYFVPWRDLRGIGNRTIEQVEKRNVAVDIRDFDVFIADDIVEDKRL